MEQSSPLIADTIAAIATPAGRGAIATIRISGSDAITIVQKCWKGKSLHDAKSHTSHLGYIISPDTGEEIDQVVATIFRAPNSFTGEDTVEISCHGSTWIQRQIMLLLSISGTRAAQGGEFSQRAFANGRIDLAQAEAIADVIASNSKAAHRIAHSQLKGGFSNRINQLREKLTELASLLELELDFSEEEVEFASRRNLRDLATDIASETARLSQSFSNGDAIKNGIPVAIVGATNTGKSTLLNAILGDNRAIVSDIHGTTRDTIEETIEIGDYTFRLIDTAGLRKTTDAIEQIGIQRSRSEIDKAKIILCLVDPTLEIDLQPLRIAASPLIDNPDSADAHLIAVINKTDITDEDIIDETLRRLSEFLNHPQFHTLAISAKCGTGLEALKQEITDIIDADNSASYDIIITNTRHAQALSQASKSAQAIVEALDLNLPGDLIAQDVRETIHHLSEITGEINTDTLLQNIFSKFCIGK